MLTIFAFAILVFEIAVLSRIDRRRFGTWVTPFNVLAYPYAVVVFLILLLGSALDFVPLYGPSVFIWIVGLFLFWASGSFLSWALLDYKPRCTAVEFANFCLDDMTVRKLATTLAWVAIPLMLYGVFSSAMSAGGLSQIGTQNFKDAYIHGVHGHAQVLASLLAIVLIALYKKGSRRQLFTIIVLLLFIVISQIKGHVMVVLMGGLLARIVLGKSRVISLKKVAALILATYLVFNVVYVIGMSVVSSASKVFTVATLQLLTRHYFYYLFAGPLALGEAVRCRVTDVGGDWSSIFAPFINIYRVILRCGPMVEAISPHEKGMVTGLISNHEVGVNVYTFFGTIYLYLGAWAAACYVIVAGVVCYLFLLVSTVRRSLWLLCGYCYVAGNLSVGFFEFYLWHLSSYEIVAFTVLLEYFSKLFQRHRPNLQLTAAKIRPASAQS